MFGFLKRLFEKTPEEVKVAFSELEGWLDSKSGPFEEQLKNDIQHLISEIEKESKNVLSLLEKIETAELQNPNVNNKVKTVMQGNREAFVKTLSRFFSELKIPFEDFDQITEESKKVQKEMDRIANSTARSYAILTQFFAREIRDVTETIKKIDTHLKDIAHVIEDNTLTKIKEIKAELETIKSKQEAKERHEKNLKEKKEEHAETSSSIEKRKKSIDEKKKSEAFNEFEAFVSQKKELEDSLKHVENTLFHDFSSMDKALKKYSKISIAHEALIERYLEDAAKALVSDQKLEIVSILENMKKAVEKDSLGLDDKKKQKTIEKITSLTKDYFESLQKKYIETEEKLKAIVDDIESHTTKKEIDVLENELASFEKKVEKFDEAIKELENEIEKFDIISMKNKIQELINSKLKDMPGKIVVH